MPAPGIRVQVAHDIAVAEQQHVLTAQGAQPHAELAVEGPRLGLIDAQLHTDTQGSENTWESTDQAL